MCINHERVGLAKFITIKTSLRFRMWIRLGPANVLLLDDSDRESELKVDPTMKVDFNTCCRKYFLGNELYEDVLVFIYLLSFIFYIVQCSHALYRL